MRRGIFAFVVVAFVSAASRAAPLPPDLLQQVQAADVLSDLITWSADRAAARSNSMQRYLKEIGKLDAFLGAPPPRVPPATGPAAQPIFYDQTFAGAVQFVEQGGDQYADPALKKLTDKQQIQELGALASYNIGEFRYLVGQRAAVAAMKAYLRSINELDAYTKWAAEKTPDVAAAPAAAGANPQSSAAMVAQTEAMMQAAKSAAQKRAEAKGVSPSDFEQQWSQQQTKLHEDISHRLEGMSELASAFSKIASAKPVPLNPAGPKVTVNQQPFGEYPFGDPFNTTYEGAGVYESNDRRINLDPDDRVNGEYDRRANLGFDRRLTIRLNPRQGV